MVGRDVHLRWLTIGKILTFTSNLYFPSPDRIKVLIQEPLAVQHLPEIPQLVDHPGIDHGRADVIGPGHLHSRPHNPECNLR